MEQWALIWNQITGSPQGPWHEAHEQTIWREQSDSSVFESIFYQHLSHEGQDPERWRCSLGSIPLCKKQRLCWCLCWTTVWQNSWGWRVPTSGPTLCSKQRQLQQVAQGSVQSGLNTPPLDTPWSLWATLSQCSTMLMAEKCFLSLTDFPIFHFLPLVSCHITGNYWQKSDSVFFTYPIRCLYTWIRSPWAVFSPVWTVSALSAYSCMSNAPGP